MHRHLLRCVDTDTHLDVFTYIERFARPALRDTAGENQQGGLLLRRLQRLLLSDVVYNAKALLWHCPGDARPAGKFRSILILPAAVLD